ncbi:MAG: hypothetical protein AB1679_12500 [Actinomycetota bacterium]
MPPATIIDRVDDPGARYDAPTGNIIDLRADRDGGPWPSVRVVVEHPAMRRVICDILQETGWFRVVVDDSDVELDDGGEGGAGSVESRTPEIVLTDRRSFLERASPRSRSAVVVIGPDIDPSYREAALRTGADAWLRPDRLVDELAPELRRILARFPQRHRRHP